MNIMYCGDAYIEQGVLLSTLSLMANVTQRLDIYLITANVTETGAVSADFAAFLDELVKTRHQFGGSVQLFDATAPFQAYPPQANLGTRFTPCCMLRLYADLLDGLPSRILYLDNDVLCNANCQTFYDRDLEGIEFVGALDYYGRFFFRKHVLHMDYLNSGVLLMNLAYIRTTGLFEKCRATCAEKKMFMPDQTALNKLAVSKRIVPGCYNDQRRQHANTVFRHFSNCFGIVPPRFINVKPWQTERMHAELHEHTYDHLLETFQEALQQLDTYHKKPIKEAS